MKTLMRNGRDRRSENPLRVTRAKERVLLIGTELAGRAQPGERMRRIGVLMGRVESDTEGQARMAAFREQFEKLGWIEGTHRPDRHSLADAGCRFAAALREGARGPAARRHSFGKHAPDCSATTANTHDPDC